VVVTLPSLQGYTIEDFGYQLGRHWGIGQKGTNTGALLIVAPNEHKVRIEVGYGLEGELTDAISATIIQNYILPSFKRGDYSAGVLAGTTSMLHVLGGNPPEISAPAIPPTQGHFTPAASVKIKPPSLPQLALMFLLVTILNPIVLIGTLLILILPRSTNRQGGSWDSDGGSSGGSSGGGGGGFSGGGGSFGGGGASGSW
jgi:uncharacterized protein